MLGRRPRPGRRSPRQGGGASTPTRSATSRVTEVPATGVPRTVPGAPYLDYRAAIAGERVLLADVPDQPWPGTDVDQLGLDHAIEVAVPDHLASVRAHTVDRVERTRAAVRDRLTREINYCDQRASERTKGDRRAQLAPVSAHATRGATVFARNALDTRGFAK